MGDAAKLARTMRVVSAVLSAVESGEDVAAPSTCERFKGLLARLQSHAEARKAYGMLSGVEQGVIGKAVIGVTAPATITP